MAQSKIAGITAKLGLDVTGVTSALKQIDKETKNIAKEMKDVDKAFQIDPNSMVVAAQKQELLAKAIEQTEKKLQELESVQEKTDKAFANQSAWEQRYEPLKKAIEETKQKLKDLQSQNDKMQSDLANGKISTQQYEAYQTELEQTKQKMTELKQAEKDLEAEFADGHISAEEYRTFQRELETTRAELNNLQNEARENEQAMTDIANGVDRASAEYRNGRTQVKEYGDAVSDLNNSINKVGTDLRGLATAAAAAVTAVTTAAVKAVGAATEVGAEFEASMSKVKAISGATAEDIALLEDAAKTMGATTSKTASESAQALSYMALAGWDTQQMLTGLEPILRASEAGEMDLATCSDLVTDSMSAMGVSVNELAHYLDVVSAAQSNSNTSMQQLLEALVTCGGTAKNFGLSIEDVSTALGVMANRGIKGSEAGNALNSIFVNMLGTTKKTKAAMETLGLELYDDTGTMKDMTTVLKEMGTALETATDEQRNNLEAMLGGKTQLTALQALVGGLNDEYDDLSKTLNNANGALLTTAKTMQDNLQGSLTTMQSALEGLGIGVYEHLEGPFREAVVNITAEIGKLSGKVKEGELADTLDRLAKSFSEIAKELTKFATDKGLPALVDGLEWLAKNGPSILDNVKQLGNAWVAWKLATVAMDVKNLITAIKAYQVAAEAATEAQIAANAAAMANVYAALAAAIAVAGTAYVQYVKDCTGAIEGNGKVVDSTTELIKALTGVSDAIEDIRDQSYKVQTAIEDSRVEFNNQKNTLSDCMDVMEKYNNKTAETEEEQKELKDAVNTLESVYNIHAETMNGMVTNYDNLVSASQRYVSQLYNEQTALLQTAEANAKKAKNDAQAIMDEAQANFDAFKSMGDEAQNVLNALSETGDLSALDTKEFYKMKKLMEDYGVDVKNFSEVWDFLVASMTNGTQMSGGNGSTIWAAVQNQLSDDYKNAKLEWEVAVDDFNKAQKELADVAYDNAKTTLASNAKGAKDAADDTAKEIAQSYEDVYNTAINNGKSMGEAAAEGLKTAMEQGIEGSDLNKIVASYMDDLDIEQLKNGYDAQWLVDEQKKIIAVLDESSDTYKKYEKQVLKSEQSIADAKTKAGAKNATTDTDAEKERVEAVKDSMAQMYKEALSGGEDIGGAIAKSMTVGMKNNLSDSELEKSFKDFVEKLDIAKLEGGKNDEWYYDQLEKAASTLDKEGSLYQDYYKKILEGRKKIDDENTKSNTKTVSEAEKTAEKIEQLKQKYQSDMGGIFSTSTKTDFYGKTTTSYTIDTSAIEKKIKAKEQLNTILGELAAKGMPQGIIDELLSMDPEAAIAFAKQLLKFPNKFDSVKKLYERDEKAAETLAKRSLGTDEEFAKAGEEAGVSYATALTNTVLTTISEKLPDLSGMLNNIAPMLKTAVNTTTTTQTVENGAQVNISDNSDKQTALLETLVSLINTNLNDKELKVVVNPTIETSVQLDGEQIAKSTSKSQNNSKVRSAQ